MTKKAKRLYSNIKTGQKAKKDEVKKLETKRKQIEGQGKKPKSTEASS
ncbi:MAG: hypothetical protein P4L10_09680 [Acidobacteriaceae bacterium]|nr:hypothetical protein [Acidobacteriaceae bacterium]